MYIESMRKALSRVRCFALRPVFLCPSLMTVALTRVQLMVHSSLEIRFGAESRIGLVSRENGGDSSWLWRSQSVSALVRPLATYIAFPYSLFGSGIIVPLISDPIVANNVQGRDRIDS